MNRTHARACICCRHGSSRPIRHQQERVITCTHYSRFPVSPTPKMAARVQTARMKAATLRKRLLATGTMGQTPQASTFSGTPPMRTYVLAFLCASLVQLYGVLCACFSFSPRVVADWKHQQAPSPGQFSKDTHAHTRKQSGLLGSLCGAPSFSNCLISRTRTPTETSPPALSTQAPGEAAHPSTYSLSPRTSAATCASTTTTTGRRKARATKALPRCVLCISCVQNG